MATLICPQCSAKYQIDDEKLQRFAKFRCKRCQHISPIQYHVMPAAPVEPAIEDEPPIQPHVIPAASGEPAIEDEFALEEQMLARLEEEQDIESIFKNEGELIPVQVNKPFSLGSDAHVWLVHTGLIDIFSIRLEQGQPIGSRRHLVRLEPGRLFCGIEAERYGKNRALIAVGSVETSILQLERMHLHELAQLHEFSAIGISELLDQWISSVLEAFKKEMIPKECQILPEAEHTLQLKNNVSYKPKKGLVWIMHREGGSRFLGNADFPKIRGPVYFPLSQRTWMHTLEPVTLEYTQTLELVGKPEFWQAFEQFQVFLLDSLISISEREALAEKGRLKRKAEDEKISFRNALTYLFSVVKKGKDLLSEDTADPLLAACRAVGNALRLTIVPHPDAQKGRNSLDDILRASRVKKRVVLLKGTWGLKDCGPFLAYIEEDKRPVALIPKSSSPMLFDPVKRSRTIVNAQVAETLEGKASTFYVPFPEHALTWKDLLKIGLQGIKGDITMALVQ